MFQIGFVDCANRFSMSIFSALEPESSMITFTGSDSISTSLSRFTATEIEGGDYLKYFGKRQLIIQGRQLIKGWLLFKEIWHLHTLVLNGRANY